MPYILIDANRFITKSYSDFGGSNVVGAIYVEELPTGSDADYKKLKTDHDSFTNQDRYEIDTASKKTGVREEYRPQFLAIDAKMQTLRAALDLGTIDQTYFDAQKALLVTAKSDLDTAYDAAIDAI